MKLRKMMLLLGALGLLAAASVPPPVGVPDMITLTPGTYEGKYEFFVMSYTFTKASQEGSTASTVQVYKLTVEGSIDITITAANRGMIVVRKPSSMSIYQDHSASITSKDFNCHVMSAMNADATTSSLGDLPHNNFAPEGPAFTYPFVISNITNQYYRGGPASSKCGYPVSQEVLRQWIDAISGAVNKFGTVAFGVSQATSGRLIGRVSIPGWNSVIPGPAGTVTQSSGGQWFAIRVVGESKGWRK
jgi:hypothetical protein